MGKIDFLIMSCRKENSFKFISLGILLVVLLIIVVPTQNIPSVKAEVQTIKIAFFQPRTAAVLNFYGTWAIQGFHLGLEYATGDKKPDNLSLLLNLKEATYNLPDGRKIVVKVFDTQGRPDVAISKAREAIEEWRANILAGETFSSVAVTLASIAKQYEKLFFIVPAAAASITQDPIFNKYIFRVARNTDQDAAAMVFYMVETLKYKKFAILAADYEFGWSFVESLQAALSKYTGTRIVALEWVPLITTDFKPYLLRINATAPDVVAIVWAGDFSLILRDYAALNMLGRIPLASIMIDLFTTNYINFCIPGLEGSLNNLTAVTYDAYRASQSPLYKVLIDMMKDENIYPYDFLRGNPCGALNKLSYARVPDLWHPPAFATAQFIVEAIKRVPDLNTDKMIGFLEGLTLETPMGTTTIRAEDHQAIRPFYIVRYIIDNDPNSDTYGLTIGEYISTIPLEKVIPRLLTSYKPFPKTFSVSIDAPITGIAPFTATLKASISGGTPPYVCQWEIEGKNITGISVTYTFSNPGVFKILLSCKDFIGLSANASASIVIQRPEQTTTPIVTVTIPATVTTPSPGDQTLTIVALVAVIVALIATLSLILLRRRAK